jgi:hypothetical protein
VETAGLPRKLGSPAFYFSHPTVNQRGAAENSALALGQKMFLGHAPLQRGNLAKQLDHRGAPNSSMPGKILKLREERFKRYKFFKNIKR